MTAATNGPRISDENPALASVDGGDLADVSGGTGGVGCMVGGARNRCFQMPKTSDTAPPAPPTTPIPPARPPTS
jgi:hypothetical protein